jgi:hypothetical protein
MVRLERERYHRERERCERDKILQREEAKY